MSNITIPNKSPGDQHTAAEVNQQTGWTNSPMKSLGAFSPAMVFDSQGYYDKYTLTSDIVITATGVVPGQFRSLWIECNGINTITLGSGLSAAITDLTNIIAAGTYLFMFGSFPDETGVNEVVLSAPNIEFVTLTPPTLDTITIENAAPTDVVMVFNEVVTGTNLGFTLAGTTSTTFASLSGSGTNTLTGVLATPAAEGETITLSYTGGDIQGVQSALLPITNQSVSNLISGSIILFQDDFAGTTIDTTTRWDIINPNPEVQFLQDDELITKIDQTVATTTRANRIESQTTFSSGAIQIDFVGAQSNYAPGFMAFVDLANYVNLVPDIDGYQRLYITVSSTNVYVYTPTNIYAENKAWKIVIDENNNIGAYFYDTSQWVQFGTTQQYNIGTNKKLAVYKTAITIAEFTLDNAYMTNQDYSTPTP